MQQLVTPNLNVKAQLARCLQYVQNAFGSPNAGVSATYAWNQTQYKHFDEPPRDVYYLAWYEYYGYVDGVYDNWGHVTIGFNGTQYSSPYTNKTTHDTIPSISEVERIYKCKYIGWSEDMAGLKVIGGQMVTPELFSIMWAAFVRTPPTEADRAYAIGKPLDQYIVDLSKNPYATVQRTDVDAIWKKLMKIKPVEADYKYAQGLNYGKYLYDVMSNPNCVSANDQSQFIKVTDLYIKK